VVQVVRAPGGRELAVEVSGHPAGEPVFLLHGTPGSLLGPRPRSIFLYRLGIRLINYNRPGYPGSTRFKDRTIADAADDIEAIADHFGIDRFSVIGRSGGAPHALACAADKRLRDRLICTASLCGLAPYDAAGLQWFDDMVESNITAYRDAAESDLQALIATFNQQAERVRSNSQGLINTLRPELVGSDREFMGDVALRRIIARTHAEALRESVDGWVDDVIALAHPWSVDLAHITAPVLLWHGGDDVFIPASHTLWLHRQIRTSELRLKTGIAHFGAIKALPDTLNWVLAQIGQAGPASERLRVDDRQQPPVAAGLDDVRVPVSEQLC